MLEADFRKLPALLGRVPVAPEQAAERPPGQPAPLRAAPEAAAVQLGLF